MGQINVGPADSIKKVLQVQTKLDSNRVSTLLKYANAIFTTDPSEAMKYADEALKISEQIKWQRGIAYSYKVKGGIDMVRGDFLNSLDYCQKALVNDLESNAAFRVGILNNIAGIYQELKQDDKAIPIYQENLTIARRVKNKEDEAMALYGIGTSHYSLKNYDSAITYINQCYSIAQTVNNNRLGSTALCALSVMYREKGSYEESFKYAEKSIKMAEESDNKYILAPAYHNLAWIDFHFGNYDISEKNIRKSLGIAKEMGGLQWEKDAWELLYQIYEKKNLPLKALEAYKTFTIIKDSVTGDEKKQEIARKEMQYAADKKETILNAEHTAKLTQEKTIKNSIIAGATTLSIGGILSFIFYKRRRDAIVLQKESEFKADLTDTEMKALRAQMNPHFIFNSLNSISDYIAKNNIKAADEYLMQFAQLMRSILENSEQKEVSLADELKALELYMQLEALRLNNKFTYEIKVDEDINKELTVIPPLILQPFVENSIWHGIAPKNGEGKIIIRVIKEGEMINCIIEDNGIGRQEPTPEKSVRKSLGMKITQSRIDILNKLKNTNASLQLSSLTEGTKVELKLPLVLSY